VRPRRTYGESVQTPPPFCDIAGDGPPARQLESAASDFLLAPLEHGGVRNSATPESIAFCCAWRIDEQ